MIRTLILPPAAKLIRQRLQNCCPSSILRFIKKAKKHSKKHFSARHAFLSRDIVQSKSVSFHERERERERTKFECQFWSKKSFQFEKGNEKHENRFIFKLSFGFGFKSNFRIGFSFKSLYNLHLISGPSHVHSRTHKKVLPFSPTQFFI